MATNRHLESAAVLFLGRDRPPAWPEDLWAHTRWKTENHLTLPVHPILGSDPNKTPSVRGSEALFRHFGLLARARCRTSRAWRSDFLHSRHFRLAVRSTQRQHGGERKRGARDPHPHWTHATIPGDTEHCQTRQRRGVDDPQRREDDNNDQRQQDTHRQVSFPRRSAWRCVMNLRWPAVISQSAGRVQTWRFATCPCRGRSSVGPARRRVSPARISGINLVAALACRSAA
jgi:hypothetical protein